MKTTKIFPTRSRAPNVSTIERIVQATLVLNPEELAAWVRRARMGDRAAFDRIAGAHRPMVIRVCRRLLRNNEDAEDAAQDVILRLYEKLDQLDQDAPLAPWLYRMTVNVCFDLIRKRRPQEPFEQQQFVYESVERSLIVRERTRAVEIALERLPVKERSALVLREVEGLSTREVAEALGSTEATVRSQIYQARLRLREWTARLMGEHV
jgi:RNA polymerase sigma factor (sigma-70 family)